MALPARFGGDAARHLVWRLPLATVLVLAATSYWARDVVALLMPLLSWAFTAVADDFNVLQFGFVDDRQNLAIGAIAQLERAVFFGERVVWPGSVAGTSVTVGTVLQPLQVVTVLLLAWPAGVREFAWRLVVVLPLLALLVLVDTPLSLASWLWFALLRQYDPGGHSWLVSWNLFLNGGGRLALALVAAVAAIVVARHLARGVRGAA